MQFEGHDYVIGIDIGGTCTDVALIDVRTRQHAHYKTESIPQAIAQGVINAIQGVLQQEKRNARDCAAFIHGTTLALNAVLTRKGGCVGLLVTAGFGDILEIGRLQMPDPFNFYTKKPLPLVRKNFVREVEERILGDGRIDTPLDRGSVEHAADDLVAAGAEIIAICFLNAFKNPAHERAAAQICGQRIPSIPISVSSDIWPEIREYERAMVTVMNAFVAPKVATYLDNLDERLKEIGLSVPVNITTSNGGMLPARLVRGRPGTTLMSGPASGIIASADLAKRSDIANMIAFDMGGTSSDFAVLSDGLIPYSTETRIGDLPIIFPSVDVVSVGAGGGSIARLDNFGVLKVGPESAGADPGPACYGRGGSNPTITDAYLVSGILDANNFLGGRVTLDRKRAQQAIDKLVAGTKYSRDELAEGIMRVATSNLILGIGRIEGRAGIDIRDFTILAYGGAGPTHACMLADELGIRRVVVPLSPGTFCALGSLSADFRMDFVQTANVSLPQMRWDEVSAWFREKEARAMQDFEKETDLIESVIALRFADIRYEGQGFNTEVPIAAHILDNADSAALAEAFHARYEQLYGFGQTSVPAELVNVRLTVIGQRKHYHRPAAKMQRGRSVKPTSTRSVVLGGRRQIIPIYRRGELKPGAEIAGPCIVDQPDTTTFIPANWRAAVDGFADLRLER
jgi:N-methylhydantoinase A